MATVDRLDACLARAGAMRQRLLVVYLTLGDPLVTDPLDVATAAVEGGADILEVGIPTSRTRPRGPELRRSFERAAAVGTARAWTMLRGLRDALPATPLVPLVYPETVDDLGCEQLVGQSLDCGADGLVLTDPRRPGAGDRLAATPLSAIPLIRPSDSAAHARRMETAARHLTYRNLSARTGDRLDLDSARRLTAQVAASATKPFLVGFGVRHAHEIGALAKDATGVVVGSQVLRMLSTVDRRRRVAAMRENVRRWKAATALHGEPAG